MLYKFNCMNLKNGEFQQVPKITSYKKTSSAMTKFTPLDYAIDTTQPASIALLRRLLQSSLSLVGT